MKSKFEYIPELIVFLMLSFSVMVMSASLVDEEDSFLVKNIGSGSAGSIVNAVMRLKTVDYNFMFIEFYDAENTDLRLDLVPYYEKKRYKKYRELENIHPGAKYRVDFRIRSIDKESGFIEAQLENYSLYFFEKLP